MFSPALRAARLVLNELNARRLQHKRAVLLITCLFVWGHACALQHSRAPLGGAIVLLPSEAVAARVAWKAQGENDVGFKGGGAPRREGTRETLHWHAA